MGGRPSNSFLLVDGESGEPGLRPMLEQFGPVRVATRVDCAIREFDRRTDIGGLVVDAELSDGLGVEVLQLSLLQTPNPAAS